MLFTKKITRTGKTGVGGRAYYNLEIRKSLFKFSNNGFSCVYFTDTYGMNPDTFFGGIFPDDFAETLCPAFPVAVMPDGTIYDYRAVSQSGE